ncbi:lipase member H isoform X1 [Oncorhynchus mykiss]|uniref:lipase member H isoform X1 n=1 Tax=Oncorhynchus mykiss TaxID=8022 RepID=UPI0018789A60|nr:lipase member H isoform X1 [Oncorhynchus mykiss]XP_036823667.1 lipase member H isoform X1 [Oncorhynchus mykiss]XP_036823668.1 lipase member H isoform X1 [Oncorhynchus mykiss]XP_036823669.1 lipase member H isoform X1 [Oncorhynchus mykiss]XP_036823670.1 lipase member H isoform X1 [Oncorhynchus mykiss]XP_036823671.1 lipase member H isoform X1 [Oncorhynchus mykiss]
MMMFWWFLALLLGPVDIYRAHECDVFTYLDLYHAIIGTSLYVKLLLYTRANLTCGQELSHHNLSAQPQFNLTKPTTFVVHGYRPTGAPPNWLNNIIEQLLARGDMNVLVVDWNRGAANINYLKVVTYSRDTADNLTAFIRNMQENGASLSSIHMIGLSLGAHITGFVGAKFNGKIGRITAVDPAGPQFNGKPPEDRLDPTDAQFVDVVHTDMDAFGFRKPLGHIDFYANGGADQPGCPLTILSGSGYFKCDHQRSVLLYLGSLNRTCNIRAFPCTSYTDFLDGLCMDCDQFKPAGCPVFGYDIIEWKESLVPLQQTKAFFTTNKQTPYCKTSYWVDIVTWNRDTRWGYITIKLHNGSEVTEATINHKASSFKKYSETRLLAQFEKDLQKVHKISIKFSRVNAFKPKYKLRVLRIRLTHLERKDRKASFPVKARDEAAGRPLSQTAPIRPPFT